MSVPVFDKVLIGGAWVRADGGIYPIVDPATEEVAGQAPECSVEQVAAAARAARHAFTSGPWPAMSGAERGLLLREIADRFEKAAPGLVDLTIAETGALRPVAAAQQVGAVPIRLRKYAEQATAPVDESVPPRPGPVGEMHGVVVREPIGVVACITPFNFPMTNCAGKIGPALACGNTVVVKPAPVDPLGVAELCRIANDVLPPGVLNFVCGRGPEIGAALVDAPEVEMISFTGSSPVGRQIQQTAGARLKRTLMELGGKSANVVLADCDLDRAVAGVANVWTFHSGQICIAGTRLLVEESIYDAFTDRLAKLGPTLRIGDPREAGIQVGPLVSATQRDRVEGFITRGVAEGARVACGGKRPTHLRKGYYVEPTLFTHARSDMVVAREEIFGPVITALPFRDDADAVALANDSEYGLYGYVWSRDAVRAQKIARGIRTGTVQINGSPMNPDAPFGGYKQSGIGRDGGRWALGAYTELKYIGWTA